jgi:hypothetical protein
MSSLNFRSSPNLQIKSCPRIMSGDVGESDKAMGILQKM